MWLLFLFSLPTDCRFISADCRFFVLFAFHFPNISVPSFIALFITRKDYTIMHHDGWRVYCKCGIIFWHYYIISYYFTYWFISPPRSITIFYNLEIEFWDMVKGLFIKEPEVKLRSLKIVTLQRRRTTRRRENPATTAITYSICRKIE